MSNDGRAFMLAAKVVVGAILILAFGLGSWYTVAPNEVAYVTRFGKIVSAAPEDHGLHFKLPIIDGIDSIRTSLDQLKIDPVNVKTLDNQGVQIGLNVSYKVPPSAARHLLFEVGRAGNFDVKESLTPVILDRALRVFATHNTIKISEERNQITADMKDAVAAQVKEMFGIEVVDLQMTHLEYSAAFQASVEQAVQAKNLAIQAENQVRQVEAQAAQTRINTDVAAYATQKNAEAQAYATQKNAEAQAYATQKNAEAQAYATKQAGGAEAYAIAQRSAALKDSPRLVELTLAQRWNGALPTQMVPGGTVPFLNLKGGQ